MPELSQGAASAGIQPTLSLISRLKRRDMGAGNSSVPSEDEVGASELVVAQYTMQLVLD